MVKVMRPYKSRGGLPVLGGGGGGAWGQFVCITFHTVLALEPYKVYVYNMLWLFNHTGTLQLAFKTGHGRLPCIKIPIF
jgi:hypothetical protein